uniref:Uncharacterized protein n=1 Tax=Glossina brevipalpis TaxID=37001 RepID=A0A1A9WSF4_9MUSC
MRPDFKCIQRPSMRSIITSCAFLPNSVRFSIFERNISPGDICTKSNLSTIRLDIVPFPEAGGPKITTRVACLNIGKFVKN